MPSRTRTTPSLSAQQLLPLLVLLVVVAYANILPHFQVGEAAGSDSSGYLNEARLVAGRQLAVPQPAPPGIATGEVADSAFIPLGFRAAGAREMVPTYPIGLPVMIALTPPLAGWDNPSGPVIWVHALVALVLIFVLGRQLGLSRSGSLLAVLFLAASPVFLLTSEQALSDTPALTWVAAAVACSWAARRRRGWSVAAGVALSVAVAIRPTNALVVVPMAVAFGGLTGCWAGLALGAAPGLAALAVLQHRLYGSALQTGYGNVGFLFSGSYLGPTLRLYAWVLPAALTPAVVLVTGLPGMVRGPARRPALLLLLWIAVFAGFYAFYFCTHEEWWYLRFLLPAFPALIIGLVFVAEAQLRRWGSALRPAGALLAGLAVLGWGLAAGAHFRVLSIPQFDRSYPAALQWMRRHLPPNAVVAAMQASGAIYHDGTFPLLRYDQYASGRPAGSTLQALTARLSDRGRTLYALLAPFEVRPALEKDMPGHWVLCGVVSDWTVWHLEDLGATPIGDSAPRAIARLAVADSEVEAAVGESWYEIESKGAHLWAWSRGDSTLEVVSQPQVTRPLKLRLGLSSHGAADVNISQDGRLLWSGIARPGLAPFTIPVALKAGRATLRFTTTSPGEAEPAANGGRQLKFTIDDPQLLATGSP